MTLDEARDTIRSVLKEASSKHGPPGGISAAWPDGTPEERVALATELEDEFGVPVQIVGDPEEPAGKAAILAARRVRGVA